MSSELVVFAHHHLPVLAWDVLYTGETPEGVPTERHVIVSAQTGRVLDSFDDVMHVDAVGTGHSLFLGTIAVHTDKQAANYVMRDLTRGGHTVYDLKGKFTGKGTLFTDADNTWGNGLNSNRQTVAVDAAAGHAYTWDYYLNVHGRHGIADDGRGATSKVHQKLYGLPYVNASWSDSCFCMSYGDGEGPLERMPKPRRKSHWHVAIAHGYYQPPEARTWASFPMTAEQIAGSGRHYIALGDSHAFHSVSSGDVTAYYSGAPSSGTHTVALVRFDGSTESVTVEEHSLRDRYG